MDFFVTYVQGGPELVKDVLQQFDVFLLNIPSINTVMYTHRRVIFGEQNSVFFRRNCNRQGVISLTEEKNHLDFKKSRLSEISHMKSCENVF
jgi:hypothetical protein